MKTLKNHLENYCEATYLFEFGEQHPEGIAQVKKLLENDYGYLDIILDEEDFKAIIKQATDDDSSLYDSLLKTIMAKAGVTTKDRYIYQGDFKNSMENATLLANKKGYRVHIFFDFVRDEKLQIAINDLISDRLIPILGYHTGNLLTYRISSGDVLRLIHDYQFYVTEAARNQRRRKYEERFD